MPKTLNSGSEIDLHLSCSVNFWYICTRTDYVIFLSFQVHSQPAQICNIFYKKFISVCLQIGFEIPLSCYIVVRVVIRLAKSKPRNCFFSMPKNCPQQISQPGSVFCWNNSKLSQTETFAVDNFSAYWKNNFVVLT